MARHKTPARNAVLASARPINLSNQRQAAKQLAAKPDWHDTAWSYFDTTPEVSQPVAYLGNQLAKIRLYPALANPIDPSAPPQPLVWETDPEDPDDVANCTEPQWQQAWLELNRLHSSSGGLPEIIRAANQNLEVTGEFFLVGLTSRSATVTGPDQQEKTATRPEEWMVCSKEEITIRSGSISVTVDWSSEKVKLTAEDFLIRIWVRHPRNKLEAYTPLRALLADCKALRSLTAQVIAAAQSRVPAGILTVSNELVFGDGTTTGGNDDDSELPPGTESFMLSLASMLEDTIDDPTAPGAYSPSVVRGPTEALKELKLVSLARQHDPSAETQIESRIRRIARGMNLPMERSLGMTETTFANGRQINLDEYEDYHAPRANLLCDALTMGFYRPQCAANPVLADLAPLLVIAADPSALFGSPDPVTNAELAHKLLLIKNSKTRELLGFTEDDAPDAEEILERIALARGYVSTDMTSPMLQKWAEEAGITIPLVPVGPASRPNSNLAASAIAATSRVNSKIGTTLAGIDRDLMTRLLVASSGAMTRALEKAGAKLSSHATKPEKQLVLTVPKYRIAATLGKERVDAITAASGDPLQGAWTDLEADFMRWGAQAQSDALEAAARVSSGLSQGDRAALGMRAAENLTEAWSWMREALDALAGARLFDPDPELTLGEVDPNLKVPPGLVREAIARAGGAKNLRSGDGTWVVLTGDGGAVGGIGTGELVSGVLRDSGGMIEAFEWDYGPGYRARPFEPHLNLDGQIFRSFDDPVLANETTWPPFTSYVAGDHDRCLCSNIPIWTFAGEEG